MSDQSDSHIHQTLCESQSSPAALLHVTLSLPPASDVPLSKSTDAGDSSLLQPEQLGRFEVLGEIGRGGMGVVLRARDPGLGRDLAIKVLLVDRQGSADTLRRFHEEAQIGGQLQHPGLVPVYELGADAKGHPFFAMKLVDGHTLAALLKARPTPADNLPRFLTIFEQVCQAMAYAHARGVIHRDLKPANVMVGAFGEVQVMDWGLAKVLFETNQERERPEQTMIQTARSESGGSESCAGSVLGTPAYMPPEQARGEMERLDARADVFGLGAILCEILTGQPPFTGRNVTELLGRAAIGDLTETFARLDDCGADVELMRLTKDCLAVEPDARPDNGSAVATRVAAYRANVEQRLRCAELERAAAEVRAVEERKRRRTQLGLAGSLLLLLLVVVGGGWYAKHQQIERQRAQDRNQRDVERALERDLAEVAERQGQSRWTEAWAALERAEGRLGESGLAALREQVAAARIKLEQVRTDRDMVARLEEARIKIPGLPGHQTADAAFREAFVFYGLDVANLNAEITAEKIRESDIQEELVSGLYQWAVALGEKQRTEAERLVRMAVLADSDPWRRKLILAGIRQNRESLLALAEEADPVHLSPANAVLVAVSFEIAGHVEKALPVLREVQRIHPDDFLINFALAENYLNVRKPAQPDEALRFYTAATALRPQNTVVFIELGNCLGKLFRPRESILAYRDACRLKPDDAILRNLLGYTLLGQNEWREAEAACREALRIKPDYADALNNLSITLRNQDKLTEAEAVCRETIRLDPHQVRPYCSLGFVLRKQGKMEASLDAFRHGHELAAQAKVSRLPTAQWLHEAERLVELAPRLPEVLANKAKPTSVAEEIEFAELCNLKHHYLAAVRLYTDAFTTDAKLMNDLIHSYRYKAVTSTALAVAGSDHGAIKLDEKESGRLRSQALNWMRDDLSALSKNLDNGKPADRFAVYCMMNLWLQDVELAALRDTDMIDKLPKTERIDWSKLWQNVHVLQQQAADIR